jgi:S-layer homology domain
MRSRGAGIVRQLALVLCVAIVAAITTPAVGQPFADTPANHWAYEALDRLAAKGLIQGYPDGTFKGDRTLTRYEMAVIMARVLARIESIQVPPPPGAPPQPEVTKEDLDLILQLVNELRTELTDKNVRLGPVEEEINALKSRVSGVKVSGAVQVRYEVARAASGDPLNGNPTTGSTSATAAPWANLAREVLRLQLDGGVTPDVRFIAVVITAGSFGTPSSAGFLAFNSSGASQIGNIDVAFLDWKNAFGWPLEIWFGRFGGSPPGQTYPVQFGPFGLLMNTAGDTWSDAIGDNGANFADGLRVAVHLADLADLQFQAVAIRMTGNTGAFTYPSGEDAFGADVNVKVMDGLRIGAYYVTNGIQQNGAAPFSQPAGALNALYHVYGPGGGSLNPVTSNCPVATGGVAGITCPALGNGWGAYVQYDIAKGIHLDGEWAQWHDTVLGGTDTGVQAVVTWDLGTLFKLWGDPTLTTGYQYYGPNFYPPYGAAELDSFGWDLVYPGNAQGFTATLVLTPFQNFNVYFDYLTGRNVSNGMSLQEIEAGIIYTFSKNTSVRVLYRDLTMGGVDQLATYRAQLDFSF